MSGPWKMIPAAARLVANVTDDEGNVVAIIPRTLADLDALDRGLSRAHLIAAAPELLKALKEAHGVLVDPDKPLDWADIANRWRAAIAKAEGRS